MRFFMPIALSGAVCAAVSHAPALHAQDAAHLRAPATIASPDSGRSAGEPVCFTAALDRRPVPWVTRRDAEAAAAGMVATLALAPFDHHISRSFGEPRHRMRTLRHTADRVAFFGGSGPFILSGLVYAAGRESRMQGIARAALHNVEAIALASSITGLTKGITGRALPDVEARHAFSFGRGFHEGNGPFVSFPSGHTAAAFAMAATVGPEISRAYPRIGGLVEPLSFGGAAAVGVARVVQHVHWPSDLPLAAVIGTWSGRAVQAHAYKKGPMAVAIRGMMIAPASHGGTTIGWSSLLGGAPLD